MLSYALSKACPVGWIPALYIVLLYIASRSVSVWPSGAKAESATALRSLQKLWSVDTVL